MPVYTDVYTVDGSKILSEQRTDEETGNVIRTIYYVYDANGQPAGMKYNGVQYWHRKNMQGDVVRILNASGAEVVSYAYDAWGKVLSVSGSLSSTVGAANPFRYRGYYYDTETGWYYLNARYYDPNVGRFLSPDLPDTLSADFENFAQYNLYTYCFNNPVNMADDLGYWPNWLTGALNVVSGALQMAAGAVLGVTTGWSGVGAVASGVLLVNGASTITQGVGQIINDVTDSDIMREDNMVKTGVQDIGNAIGGDTGREVAGVIYDTAVAASSFYAGRVGLQHVGKVPIKVSINKVLNNPMDDFVTVGPAQGVISEYCRSIPYNGYGKIYAKQLPSGFYQLANGHHRVAALKSIGIKKIKIYLTK